MITSLGSETSMQFNMYISCLCSAFGAHSTASESVVIVSAPHGVSLVICPSISNNSLIVGSMHMHTNRKSIIGELFSWNSNVFDLHFAGSHRFTVTDCDMDKEIILLLQSMEILSLYIFQLDDVDGWTELNNGFMNYWLLLDMRELIISSRLNI